MLHKRRLWVLMPSLSMSSVPMLGRWMHWLLFSKLRRRLASISSSLSTWRILPTLHSLFRCWRCILGVLHTIIIMVCHLSVCTGFSVSFNPVPVCCVDANRMKVHSGEVLWHLVNLLRKMAGRSTTSKLWHRKESMHTSSQLSPILQHRHPTCTKLSLW